MVLGYRRVEAGEATVEDENNEIPEQNTTSSARARRRLGDVSSLGFSFISLRFLLMAGPLGWS